MKTCIIIGAGGRGKDSYAPLIHKSERLKIVGVAETDENKRAEFCKTYGIEPDMCFCDYRELFAQGRLADAVLICTQDRLHYEPTLLAMENGYHIMLEKPISPVESEIESLAGAVAKYDKIFMTGFVLRYTPFIQKIKALCNDGAIGKIVTMQLNENEGYWHHAHSYVRGQWNNDSTSSPLILAKSCHDMDLILYMMESECVSVAASGSNMYFKHENAPGDVPLRCTDGCAFADTCPYNAVRLYTEGEGRYFVHKFECEPSDEAIIRDLAKNTYGRCVYRCDNNVCDHQVVNFEFANGATAVFTVSAFSLENTRTVKIMGTEGEIGGCMETGEITLKRFNGNTVENFVVHNDGTKHCGGDSGLINYFTELVETERVENDMNIFKAHSLAFAAEKSRKNKMTVTVW